MQVVIESGFAQVGAGTWLMGRGQPVAFRNPIRRLHRRGWMLRDRSHLELVETVGDAECADSQRPFLTHIPCAAPISAVSEKVLVAPKSAWAGAEMLRVIPMSVSGSMAISHFALPEKDVSSFDRSIVSSSKDHEDESNDKTIQRSNDKTIQRSNDPTIQRSNDQTIQRSNDPTIQRSNDTSWVIMATEGRTKRLVLEDGQTLSVKPDAVVAWTGNKPTGFCPKLGVMDLILPRMPRELLLNFYGPGIVWVEGARRRPSRISRERRVW